MIGPDEAGKSQEPQEPVSQYQANPSTGLGGKHGSDGNGDAQGTVGSSLVPTQVMVAFYTSWLHVIGTHEAKIRLSIDASEVDILPGGVGGDGITSRELMTIVCHPPPESPVTASRWGSA